MEIEIKIDYTNTILGERRRAAGMSQSQLAAASGISVRVLQDYEQGKRNLNGAKLATLLQLCKALGCKLDALITDPDCLAMLKEIYG